MKDGQTDKQTDGQTDECDFTGRCLTNVKHPISFQLNILILFLKHLSNFVCTFSKYFKPFISATTKCLKCVSVHVN